MRTLDLTPFNGSGATFAMTGAWIPCRRFNKVSMSAATTRDSALAGTLNLQFTNEQPPSVLSASAFTPTEAHDLSGSALNIAGSGNTNVTSDIAHEFVRPVWTPTAGTSGKITVRLAFKGWP